MHYRSACLASRSRVDTVQIGPLVEQPPSELWTVVDPDGLRPAPFDDKTVEDLDDVEGSEIGSRQRCEALFASSNPHHRRRNGRRLNRASDLKSMAHTSLGAAIAGRPIW